MREARGGSTAVNAELPQPLVLLQAGSAAPGELYHPYPTPLGTRIFGPVMRLSTWKNGSYYDSGPFYNVFTGKPWSVK